MDTTRNSKKSKTAKGPALSAEQYATCKSVLEDCKRRGEYPITVKTLLDKAEIRESPGASALVGQAAAPYYETSARKGATGGEANGALAFLPGDADYIAGRLATLRVLIHQSAGESRTTLAFTVTQIAETKGHAGAFLKLVRTKISAGTGKTIKITDLPPGVGALKFRGNDLLFLFDDVTGTREPAVAVESSRFVPRRGNDAMPHPSSPALDVEDLSRQIVAAFDRINARTGSFNQVLLADLRKEVGAPRGSFDQAIDRLRRSATLSLSAHEGHFDQLTPEQREGGIQGPSAMLVYAARRNP
ncbi:MAG: hypothetical protein ABTD50_20165 [Polyangiaceae bacterium]|jgi:hypothetical protein